MFQASDYVAIINHVFRGGFDGLFFFFKKKKKIEIYCWFPDRSRTELIFPH